MREMSGGHCNVLGKEWTVTCSRVVAWEVEVIAHNIFSQILSPTTASKKLVQGPQ